MCLRLRNRYCQNRTRSIRLAYGSRWRSENKRKTMRTNRFELEPEILSPTDLTNQLRNIADINMHLQNTK
jgi:hypothetical protein